MRYGESLALAYLDCIGRMGADDNDIRNAVRFADRFGDLDELKRYIMNGLADMGYFEPDDTLSWLKIRIPSIGEVIQKATGYIAGRIGGERARKAAEQKMADINREATKFAQHPVGQAIIAGGLIAMTGGLGAGSLVGRGVQLAGQAGRAILTGAKAVIGGASKIGGIALKGVGKLGKMALTGAKKLSGAVSGLFKKTPAGPSEPEPPAPAEQYVQRPSAMPQAPPVHKKSDAGALWPILAGLATALLL